MSEWVFAADWVKRRRIYVSGLVIGACVVLGCLLLLNFPVDDLFSRNGLMVGLVITELSGSPRHSLVGLCVEQMAQQE
jgi:hypothetical protein